MYKIFNIQKQKKGMIIKMKKQHIIMLVVAIVIVIAICLIMIFSGNKSKQGQDNNTNVVEFNPETDIDWENIEVTTIKFKLKNSTGKDISKIYMRNNRNENFSEDLTEEIKNEEEKEVEYGNYSPLYSWDMKIVFADETEKTLNSMLAANILYDEATLELLDLGETVDAVNHNLVDVLQEQEGENPEANPEANSEVVEENTEETSEVTSDEAETETTEEVETEVNLDAEVEEESEG